MKCVSDEIETQMEINRIVRSSIPNVNLSDVISEWVCVGVSVFQTCLKRHIKLAAWVYASMQSYFYTSSKQKKEKKEKRDGRKVIGILRNSIDSF